MATSKFLPDLVWKMHCLIMITIIINKYIIIIATCIIIVIPAIVCQRKKHPLSTQRAHSGNRREEKTFLPYRRISRSDTDPYITYIECASILRWLAVCHYLSTALLFTPAHSTTSGACQQQDIRIDWLRDTKRKKNTDGSLDDFKEHFVIWLRRVSYYLLWRLNLVACMQGRSG